MKRKIVLIASLAAGIVAAVLTRIYLSAKDREVESRIDEVYRNLGGKVYALAFTHEVPAGKELTENDLGYMPVPAKGVNGLAVTKDEYKTVIGRTLRVGHKKNDVLFWADLEGGNLMKENRLSSVVSRGMRAVSINCSGAASVSSMVKPDDYVDVIGTFNLDGTVGSRDFVTLTLLQNVHVLATGNETAKLPSRRPSASSGYSTVTLEVTSREAEMLAFAEQIKGRLILTLRATDDMDHQDELPEVNLEKIKSEFKQLDEDRVKRHKGRGYKSGRMP